MSISRYDEEMQRTRYLLVGSLAALAAGVLALLVLLLRQGATHDRVLMEYRASQALSGLIDLVTAGEAIGVATLPDEVLGFGAYTISGEAIVYVGSAPRRLTSPPPNGGGAPGSTERSTRSDTVLQLVRTAGSRGAFGRGGYGRGLLDTGYGRDAPVPPAPPTTTPEVTGRVTWLIEYDISRLLQERRLRVAAIAGLFVLITGFSFATVHLVNTVRRAEVKNRKTEALAQLGAAARTITHEIKNPLASIRLHTSLLRRVSDDPERITRTVDIIDEEVERLGALAEGVRNFLGDPRGTPERIEPCVAVQHIAERQQFPVVIECHEQSKDGAVIKMDRLRFDSVITNLCGNAWHAQEDGPPVTVTVARDGRTVSIFVMDRGPGIPKELRERVFDPFFTTRDGGSGVGLAAARSFVEAAGGQISIAERDGGGAVVRVVLPAGEDTTP